MIKIKGNNINKLEKELGDFVSQFLRNSYQWKKDLFFNVLIVETSVIIGVILLLVLLLCSALVSGAEVALFSLTFTDLNEESANYSKRLDIISKLLDSPKKLLATILVANNFINIAIVLLFAYLGNFIFEDISSLLIRSIASSSKS